MVDFFLNSSLETVCFLLITEVQSDLAVISRKGMKEWLWG